MPFKDPEKRRQYYREYSRKWMKEYRENNRDECNRKQREYKKNRRLVGADTWYNASREKRRKYAYEYWLKNKEKMKQNAANKTVLNYFKRLEKQRNSVPYTFQK